MASASWPATRRWGSAGGAVFALTVLGLLTAPGVGGSSAGVPPPTKVLVAPFAGTTNTTNGTSTTACSNATVLRVSPLNLSTGASFPGAYAAARACNSWNFYHAASATERSQGTIPLSVKAGLNKFWFNFTANFSAWTNLTPGTCVNGSFSHYSYECYAATGANVFFESAVKDLTTGTVLWMRNSAEVSNGVAVSYANGWSVGNEAGVYCNKSPIFPCPPANYSAPLATHLSVVGSVSQWGAFYLKAKDHYALYFQIETEVGGNVWTSYARMIGTIASGTVIAYGGGQGLRLRSVSID